jgi:outer membrane protein
MRVLHKYSIAFILLLCLAGNRLYAQDSVKVLLLDDCIKLGLEQSAQVLRSQDSVEITGAELMGAYGQFLPDLNFGANYSYLSGNNLLTTGAPTLVDSKESQMNYQLTSTINIFNGFSNQASLQAATLSKSASQYNLDRVKQQIAFDITQTFLQIILDRKIVEYGKQNLDASTKREAELQEQTNVGRRAIADLYQQQAETSSDNLFLIQSDNKLRNDIILLLRKLKISQTDKYNIGTIVVDTLPFGAGYQNVQDLLDKAIQQRPDLKSSTANISIAQYEVKNFESGYYPKVSLEGGLVSNGGYFNYLYINGSDELGPQEPFGKALFGQIYGEALLNVSWHIFDRFYNKTNVAIAKINEQNAQIANDDLTVQVSSEIKQAYNDYLAALEQIETAKRGIIAATQAYQVVNGEYNVGKATFVELSNAQTVLLQSQVNKAQADVNLSLQKKIINFYLGI